MSEFKTTQEPKVWPPYPLKSEVLDLAKELAWNYLSEEQQEDYYKRSLSTMRKAGKNV